MPTYPICGAHPTLRHAASPKSQRLHSSHPESYSQLGFAMKGGFCICDLTHYIREVAERLIAMR
jgi:hypothetical protein